MPIGGFVDYKSRECCNDIKGYIQILIKLTSLDTDKSVYSVS